MIIIKSAGNAIPKVTNAMRGVGAVGKIFLVVAVVYAGREIYYAENREKESIRQTTTLLSGIATRATITIGVSSHADAPISIFVLVL